MFLQQGSFGDQRAISRPFSSIAGRGVERACSRPLTSREWRATTATDLLKYFEMREKSSRDVTAILHEAQKGDPKSAARLLPLVYDELRKLAAARMAKLPPGQTLQPTALTHEVYARMLGKQDLKLESRRHFFFVAQARSKAGPRRGGNRRRVELKDDVAIDLPAQDNVLAVHEALSELEKEDPVKAQIVNLRYFAGMSIEETIQVLEMSERTFHRHWRFAKAWLKSRLAASADREG
jgi:RNA polymerase sigma factor (TIGR02999 family)